MYLNHITLPSGHTRRSPRAEVSDEALALLAPWLRAAANSGGRAALPVAELSHYSAAALIEGGGLVVTIYGPAGPHVAGRPHAGDVMPLVALGVAQRSRQGGDLWAMMLANFGCADGLQKPGEPWCAVALHPSLIDTPDAAHWLGDLERCIAWAWITRSPQIGAIND